MEMLYSFFILTCVLFIFFLPSIIAYRKYHRNSEAIFLTNCFLGWTGFGWIVALIWSATNPDD